MMGGILAAGGRYGRRDRVFSRGELERDHTLYFHNVTCKAETDVWTVEEDDIFNKATGYCMGLKRFRPLTALDSRNGEGSTDHHSPVILLEGREQCYRIGFYYFSEQTALDFQYREEPLMVVSCYTPEGESLWEWFCKMPPDDHVLLYELAQTYVGDRAGIVSREILGD